MEKDIDDLLDEVETKFVGKNARSSRLHEKEEKPHKPKAISRAQKPSTVLDDVIDDILDIDVNKDTVVKNEICKDQLRASLSDDLSKLEQTRRCFPVFLGGSKDEMGRGASMNKRPCDQLRCTSCDFKVCFFDDLSWSKDTDYLFLRNNVPELQKLKSKLNRKKGCRAYCCQCSWQNVMELFELKEPSLKWVCGKHAL